MNIDDVIAELAPGRSFIDVGGLWGTVNERVSVAKLAGATRATMFDLQTPGNEYWRAFEERCAARGVTGYASVHGDLNDDAALEALGRFDLVHCSGVLYHVPSPMQTLEKLARLTGRHLLLGACTVPERIENAAGSLDFSDGRMLFIPALDGQAKAVLAAHYDMHNIKLLGVNSDAAFGWGAPGAWDYAPWWWFWSVGTVARMCELAGFRVTRTFEAWPGLAHYLVCETA